jgi:hypothetical protein
VPFATVGIIIVTVARVANSSHPLSAPVVINRVVGTASVMHFTFYW